MKILVTNDDGIFAEGIYKLALELNKNPDYKIYVVAPDRQRSATGHAITVHHPLRSNKINYFDTSIEAWSINGTPADCVKIAIETLLNEKPDMVISGINDGPNLGTDVLYSGTVSAAIEGAIHDIKAIAVSIAGRGKLKYAESASYIVKVIEKVKDMELPVNTLLNINIPNEDNIKGIKVTTLGIRRYKNTFVKRFDPRGDTYYWLGGEVVEEEQKEDSDVMAIREGFVSMTPIQYDLTNYSFIEKLREWSL